MPAQLASIERRGHYRHPVDVCARYWTEDERAAVACDILDLSEGGACIELPAWAWIEPRSYATLELPVPGGLSLMTTLVHVLAVSVGERRRAHLCFADDSEVFRILVAAAAREWARRDRQFAQREAR
jgi:hypothetical protein